MIEKVMLLLEKEFLIFLLEWFFVFGFCGFLLAGVFQRLFNKDGKIHYGFMTLIGVGFAPMLLSTVLYYAYLLVPKAPNWLYFGLELMVIVTVFIFGRKEGLEFFKRLKNKLFFLFKRYKILSSAVTFGGMLFLFGWLVYFINRPITEHDTMEYAVQGKTFFQDAEINYNPTRINENGFYYVGLHGFSFVLQATNERLMNSFLGNQNDLYFRSINPTFGILILLGFFLLGYLRNGLAFGLFLGFGFLYSFGIFETLIKFHIDNFRVFYFLIALFWSWHYLANPNFRMLLFVGILLGAQANAHTLGCLLAIVSFGTLFLFDKEKLGTRLKNYALAFCFFLFFGGLHYILDVAYGTGWIFQEIKFY